MTKITKDKHQPGSDVCVECGPLGGAKLNGISCPNLEIRSVRHDRNDDAVPSPNLENFLDFEEKCHPLLFRSDAWTRKLL